MHDQFSAALQLLPNYLGQHTLLCAAALTLGVSLALPLAFLAARRPRIRFWVLSMTGLFQTIPGLALLAMFYPLLLGLSDVAKALVGIDIPALGFLPSVAALTLYSMMPIVRNGIAGFVGIDPAVLEAADAVGMTPRQRFLRVEAPLAAPVVMAGIRTAAVWTIGTATLSTSVGQTSLGNYIFSGLQTQNWVFVLFGCVAAAVLATVVDQLLGLIETGLSAGKRGLIGLGTAGLALGFGLTFIPLGAVTAAGYVVGAKNFTEQYILAELISRQIRVLGARAEQQENLGSAIAFRALANDEIDVYVDYTGTLWTNVMQRRDRAAPAQMQQQLTQWLAGQYGVLLLGNLGFENAYVFAMRRDRAAALGITSITDLKEHSAQLALGTDFEFLVRPEWTTIKDAYQIDFGTKRSFEPTFMYRAVLDRSVDVISAFSSDGRIASDDLLVLTDPLHAIPSYEAVVLISPKRSKDRLLIDALTPLLGRISIEQMRQANLMVDRGSNRASPREAAGYLARSIGLQDASAATTP
jgi:osmoprotectant transport system permease protein